MRLRNRLSLRFALLVFVCAATATVAGSFILDSRKRASWVQTVDGEVVQLLEIVALPAAIAAYELDAVMAMEIVDGLVRSRYLAGARIIDDFGDTLAATWSRDSGSTISRCADLLALGGTRRVELVTMGGTAVGFLEVELDEAALCRTIRLSRQIDFLAHSIMGLVVVLVVTIGFAVWFLKPLLGLHTALSRVLNGEEVDAQIAVPKVHRSDELGELATKIRGLAERYREDLARSEDESEDLRISLKEKESLLREIHHRVKNNLQIILSLLNLQASGGEDQPLCLVVEVLRARVYAMSLVHEHLYQSSDLSHVELDEYTRRLVDSLRSVYGVEEGDIELRADPVRMDLNRTILYGLIMNELVSNALKYGRASDNAPISIAVGYDDDKIRASVADQGPGLPDPSLLDESPTLGLRLIKGLAAQLSGSVTYTSPANPAGGSQFVLRFPAEQS